MMKINKAGLDLIKHFEGLSLIPYRDIVGRLTIGYGRAYGVTSDMIITEEEAYDMLLNDIASRCNQTEHLIFVTVSSNEFSALVSFVYNLGIGSLRNSSLLRKLNQGDKAGAADEFLKWNHAGGRVVAGITTRREAERALFLTPDNLTLT